MKSVFDYLNGCHGKKIKIFKSAASLSTGGRIGEVFRDGIEIKVEKEITATTQPSKRIITKDGLLIEIFDK